MSEPTPPTPSGGPDGPRGPGADGTAETARGLGRGWRLVLIASLGLNLLVAGVVGGAVFGEWRDHGRPIVRDLGFGPYGEALSPSDRTALIHAFAKETGGFRAERKVARENFGQLLSVLRTTPFNAGEMKVLMTQQEQHMAGRLALGQKLLIERIETMSPDERHAFADRLEKALSRKGHHRPPKGRAKAECPPADATGATPDGAAGTAKP
ncbi:periplasmic heavy metal sensor [Acidimangrovimonas sediminis]|uniref:periplasmic heavy metal sensor n=1 Tax=Acidimangrovimonas sediminis TaxID=2056283 RepID=UPI0013048BD4|nr:periplasmic heavy metal sensor [Acidimangrovimonas sediminis]